MEVVIVMLVLGGIKEEGGTQEMFEFLSVQLKSVSCQK